MKRPVGWAIVLIAGAALATTAQAQVTALPIVKRTLLVVGKEEDRGNQLIFQMIDTVQRGFDKSQTMSFEAGSKYRIYAVGDDNRILDIDLSVLDGDGDEVASDQGNGHNVAVVEVRVKQKQKFTLKIHPNEMAKGIHDGFFSLVVVRVD